MGGSRAGCPLLGELFASAKPLVQTDGSEPKNTSRVPWRGLRKTNPSRCLDILIQQSCMGLCLLILQVLKAGLPP
jgi:hypothetical protein